MNSTFRPMDILRYAYNKVVSQPVLMLKYLAIGFVGMLALVVSIVPIYVVANLLGGAKFAVGVSGVAAIFVSVLMLAGFIKLILQVLDENQATFSAFFQGRFYWLPMFVFGAVIIGLVAVLSALIGLFAKIFVPVQALVNKETLIAFAQTNSAAVVPVLTFALVTSLIAMFFVLRIFFAQYYIVDQNSGPIEAIRESWNVTRGKVLRIVAVFALFVVLVDLPINLFGGLVGRLLEEKSVLYILLTSLVGVLRIAAGIIKLLAYARLYRLLSGTAR